MTDETTGQAICAFVVLCADYQAHDGIVDELRVEVAREISPIAKPREVHVVPELPKTRSGKIMRRLLRDVAENRELGDTSTLLDPGVFEAIKPSQVAQAARDSSGRLWSEPGAGPVLGVDVGQ